jgi:hypothetical protein
MNTVRKFAAEEMKQFLRAVDQQLAVASEIVLIGGTAIALHFDVQHATSDIDLIEVTPDVLRACTEARAQTGLAVPVTQVGVYFAPEGFRDRCDTLPIAGLRSLRVVIPERHDLAIMKIARGYEHDLQAIEAMHKAAPLVLETLTQRYRETWVTGRREAFKLSLLALVDHLFGPDCAKRVDDELTPP